MQQRTAGGIQPSILVIVENFRPCILLVFRIQTPRAALQKRILFSCKHMKYIHTSASGRSEIESSHIINTAQRAARYIPSQPQQNRGRLSLPRRVDRRILPRKKKVACCYAYTSMNTAVFGRSTAVRVSAAKQRKPRSSPVHDSARPGFIARSKQLQAWTRAPVVQCGHRNNPGFPHLFLDRSGTKLR